jgi:hypothetical protein
MSARTAKYGLSVVGTIKARLTQAPDREVAEVSKQGIIDRLVPELLALHARGYTWQSIAGVLAEEGVEISGAALGAYVRRGSATPDPKKDRAKRKRLQTPIETTPQGTPLPPAPPRSTPSRPSVPSEAAPPARPTTVEPPSPEPAMPTLGTSRSSFVPRRRSEDI